MTPREALALVTDESDAMGDETQNMGAIDADLAFQLRMSVAMARQDKRIAALEKDLETQRHAINRVIAALLTRGIQIPTEADHVAL